MKIDILTLFPKMFSGFLNESLILRAQKKGLVKIMIRDLRKFSTDKHKTVDDRPYGGGPGMILKVDVMDRAISKLQAKNYKLKPKIILLTPQGKVFNQKKALSLSRASNLILICGHYEGFDERIRKLVNEEISIGDYVLTGGELPAQVVCDAVIRLIPGVVGKEASLKEESFSLTTNDQRLTASQLGWLEYPQYTRPENYQPKSIKTKKPLRVPKILLSGNHQKITDWRLQKSLQKTKKQRPDLIKIKDKI